MVKGGIPSNGVGSSMSAMAFKLLQGVAEFDLNLRAQLKDLLSEDSANPVDIPLVEPLTPEAIKEAIEKAKSHLNPLPLTLKVQMNRGSISCSS